MIRLILYNFTEFWQVFVDVLDPLALLLHDVLGCASVSYLPFVNELAHVAYFGCDGGNSQLAKSPIVLISADGDTHGLFGSSSESSLGEFGVSYNLCEDWENTGSSLVDVVLLSPVERVNESIAV